MRFLFLLLFVPVFVVEAQNIDSLRAKYLVASVKEKLPMAMSLSKAFMGVNVDSARHYAELSLRLINKELSDSLCADIYGQYVLTLVESGDYEAFRNEISSYLPPIEHSGNRKAQSGVYTSYGNYFLAIKQPEKAIVWYYKSHEIEEEIGDEIGKASILGNIALIQKRTGEYEKAMANFMKVLRIYEKQKDDQTVLRILVNISGFYRDEHASIYNIDSAIHYGRESLILARRLKFHFGEAMAGINFSAATTWKNLNLLIDEKVVSEGLEAAIYSRTFFEQTNFTSQYHNSLNNEALSYEILGSLNEAERIAQSLIHSPHVSQYAHRILYKVYQKKGDYRRALVEHEQYKIISDSLLEVERRNQLAEVQTKYESATKDAEIESLSKEAAIKALDISRKNTIIFAVSIGSVVLFIVVYLLYIQRTSKQKQKHSELSHRFLRTQLNPHFIFNALAAIQNFVFKNSPQDAGKYLAKFSALMRQILENSREEFIAVDEEVKMLQNYLDVHQLNTEKAFTYEIAVDDGIDIANESIPPMFVQPFVENAIAHGISTIENGHIMVSFFKEDKFIRIEITDNGKGLLSAADSNTHKSLSSKIIQERIDLFNQHLKHKIQFLIDEIKGDKGEVLGTKVRLTVPFNYL